MQLSGQYVSTSMIQLNRLSYSGSVFGCITVVNAPWFVFDISPRTVSMFGSHYKPLHTLGSELEAKYFEVNLVLKRVRDHFPRIMNERPLL
jgi:hypothetical protein